MLSSLTVSRTAAPETQPQEFSRKDALRLTGLTERTLREWEAKELIPAADRYSFPQLIALRALARLKAQRVPAAKLRKALDAVRERLGHIENPLAELGLLPEGKRIRVQIGNQKMEADTGQLLLDFADEQLRRVVNFPTGPREREREAAMDRKQREAESWFEKALELEHHPAMLEQAMDAYKVAIALDPSMAAAMVNLGTLYFNIRDLEKAAKYYKRAVETNPAYPLAHFNLGNLHDECGNRAKAQQCYLQALKLDPNYTDAHYNLALLYQATGETMKAVRHWRQYLKLDGSSPWAEVARRELDKLYARTVVRGAGKRAGHDA